MWKNFFSNGIIFTNLYLDPMYLEIMEKSLFWPGFTLVWKLPLIRMNLGGKISLLAFEYFQLLEIAKHCPKVKGSYFASHGLRRLFSSILNECHENFLSWVIVDGIEDILNWHQLCRNKCQRSFQFVDSVSIFSFIGSLIIQPGNFKLLFQWSFFSRSNTL